MTKQHLPETEGPRREPPAGTGSVARRIWMFLRENKRWWLVPILVVFLLFGLFVLLTHVGDSGIFVYD